MKVRNEIGGKTGYRGDINIMNVDVDIVDGGCNGEGLSDGVGWGKGVGGDVDEGGGVMIEGNKSSTTVSPGRYLCAAV